MDLTLQLSFRIALVWAGGFLIAAAVQAILPNGAGINLTGKGRFSVHSIQPHGLLDLRSRGPHRHRPCRGPRDACGHRIEQVRNCLPGISNFPVFKSAAILLPMKPDQFEESQRLTSLYSEMGDIEIRELAAGIDDLTDVAKASPAR